MAMRELGRRMVDLGAFDEIEDFGFVRAAEMPTLFDDPHSMTEAIRSRRTEYRQLQELEPPFVFVGHAEGPDTWPRRDAATVDRLSAGETIAGMPGCPGIAEGTARVILDSNDPSALEPGDVLVAPITDPSWTPLFVPAAGVVVDVGAALSHGCAAGTRRRRARQRSGRLLLPTDRWRPMCHPRCACGAATRRRPWRH